MSQITLSFTNEDAAFLQELADEAGDSVETVIRKAIAAYLEHNRRFKATAKYLLEKNSELYRRLAQHD